MVGTTTRKRLAFALAFVLPTACASSSGAPPGNGNETSSAGGSLSTAGQAMVAGSSGAGQGNASPTGGTASAGASAGNPVAGATSGAPGAGGGATCRDQVPEAEWETNCLTCAGDDPCAACLCQNCAAAVRACESTQGCKEIATCVQEAACSGIECYCGTDTGNCANGGGNGPCRDVILAAPGGKPPTLADPSGGPASDAVAQVALCMQGATTCGSSCN